MYTLKVYRLSLSPRSIVARTREMPLFSPFGLRKKRGKNITVRIWRVCVTREPDRIGGTEGLLFEERRRGTQVVRKGTNTLGTRGWGRGSREGERGRRSRTLGGSSQSSGWVSTRPVIIGAYLHEHTSNVPNQTSSHVARVGRYCNRVYKARLFLLSFLVKKKKAREEITLYAVFWRFIGRKCSVIRSENLLARRVVFPAIAWLWLTWNHKGDNISY